MPSQRAGGGSCTSTVPTSPTIPWPRPSWLELDLRCRDIIARHIDQFAASIDLDLPLPATQLVELTNALSDGLRGAHADGRASMTSGRGLRLVVGSMIEASLHRRGRTT